jgi:hypothetical protein
MGSVSPASIDSDMRRNRRKGRNPLFAKRWFSDEVIVVSVGWYLRFKLSYRDLAHILSEMGVAVVNYAADPPAVYSAGWISEDFQHDGTLARSSSAGPSPMKNNKPAHNTNDKQNKFDRAPRVS